MQINHAIAKMLGDVQKTPQWETVRARNAWVNIYNPEVTSLFLS
jgi:putative tricarboxylic transport membrane protein